MTEKELTDRQIEKILYNCINLMRKGYDLQYCMDKFSKYKDILSEYFLIMNSFKMLDKKAIDHVMEKRILNSIYSDEVSPNDHDEQVAVQIPDQRRKVFFRILKPAIIFLFVFALLNFSFIGFSYASQDSIPGDTLYSTKRNIEQLKLVIYPKSSKSIIHFQILNSRIYEAEKLFNSNKAQKTVTDVLIREAEEEFDQCKKYEYFDGASEEEFEEAILDIKERSEKEFNEEAEEKYENNDNIKEDSSKSEKDSNESEDQESIEEESNDTLDEDNSPEKAEEKEDEHSEESDHD